MGAGYRPPPPEKVGRSDLVRIERERRRIAVLAVVGSVLVFFLAVKAMTRFARSWRAVTVMAMRAIGREPAPPPKAEPQPVPEPIKVPETEPPAASPPPLWDQGEKGRFFWVEVEPSEAADVQSEASRGGSRETSRVDLSAPGIPVSRLSQLPVCPYALEPQPGDAIEAASMETVGGLRPIGMCGSVHAYELINRSGGVLNAVFTDNQGQQWDVLVPPGGTVHLKSAVPLEPGLIGRPK